MCIVYRILRILRPRYAEAEVYTVRTQSVHLRTPCRTPPYTHLLYTLLYTVKPCTFRTLFSLRTLLALPYTVVLPYSLA